MPTWTLSRSRLRSSALALGFALGLLTACKPKQKPFPPAPVLPTLTKDDPNANALDAGVVAPALGSGGPDRMALEQAKTALADVDAMVKKGALTNPDKPEGVDAAGKCAALESLRSVVERMDDPEAKKLLAETKRICNLEVPILSADKALKQVTISPSQASRKLICGFASKDLEKARASKVTDRRIRDLEVRFSRACR